MLIDCDTCLGRDVHCGDCVVTVLLGMPAARAGLGHLEPAQDMDFDVQERIALGVLADGGLVPPLRLAPALPRAVPQGRSPATGSSDRASRIAHAREVS